MPMCLQQALLNCNRMGMGYMKLLKGQTNKNYKMTCL